MHDGIDSKGSYAFTVQLVCYITAMRHYRRQTDIQHLCYLLVDVSFYNQRKHFYLTV